MDSLEEFNALPDIIVDSKEIKSLMKTRNQLIAVRDDDDLILHFPWDDAHSCFKVGSFGRDRVIKLHSSSKANDENNTTFTLKDLMKISNSIEDRILSEKRGPRTQSFLLKDVLALFVFTATLYGIAALCYFFLYEKLWYLYISIPLVLAIMSLSSMIYSNIQRYNTEKNMQFEKKTESFAYLYLPDTMYLQVRILKHKLSLGESEKPSGEHLPFVDRRKLNQNIKNELLADYPEETDQLAKLAKS